MRGEGRGAREAALLVPHPSLLAPLLQVVPQFLGAARVAQLAERLRLDLADPLAGDAELAADLFQRPLPAVVRPKRSWSTRRSRPVNESRTSSTCSLSSWCEAASEGAIAPWSS